MADNTHVNGNGAAAVDPADDGTDADIDSVCATIGKR